MKTMLCACMLILLEFVGSAALANPAIASFVAGASTVRRSRIMERVKTLQTACSKFASSRCKFKIRKESGAFSGYNLVDWEACEKLKGTRTGTTCTFNNLKRKVGS